MEEARVVPRAHPSRTLLYAYFNRSGSREAFSFLGGTWDRFRCTVEPSPGHIRCQYKFCNFPALSVEIQIDPPSLKFQKNAKF